MCVSRRNTSVDESYEWDAVECSVDPNILEAMKMERTHAGFGRGREFRQDRPRSTAGLQDFQSKRKNFKLFEHVWSFPTPNIMVN